MSAFTTDRSKYGAEKISVANRINIPLGDDVPFFEAALPERIYFDGRDKEKKIKNETVNLGLPEVTLFLEELPPQSIRRIFEYGFIQYLSDSYASATDVPEAQAKFRNRIDLLVSGELTARRTNTPARKAKGNPDFPIIAKFYAKQLLQLTEKNFGGTKPATKDKEASAKWDQAHIEAMLFLANLPKVKARVEEEKKRLEEMQRAADEDLDEIMGDLIGPAESEGEGDETEGEEDEAAPDEDPETAEDVEKVEEKNAEAAE